MKMITANLNITPKHKWIDYYKALWSKDNVKAEHNNVETNNSVTYEGDLITMDELEEALGRTINQKATGQDGLNAECFKYRVSCLNLDYYISIIHVGKNNRSHKIGQWLRCYLFLRKETELLS